MQYTLSAVGEDLSAPLISGIAGEVDDAVRAAEAILQRVPACQVVEIFSGGRFLRDVARQLN